MGSNGSESDFAMCKRPRTHLGWVFFRERHFVIYFPCVLRKLRRVVRRGSPNRVLVHILLSIILPQPFVGPSYRGVVCGLTSPCCLPVFGAATLVSRSCKYCAGRNIFPDAGDHACVKVRMHAGGREGTEGGKFPFGPADGRLPSSRPHGRGEALAPAWMGPGPFARCASSSRVRAELLAWEPPDLVTGHSFLDVTGDSRAQDFVALKLYTR